MTVAKAFCTFDIFVSIKHIVKLFFPCCITISIDKKVASLSMILFAPVTFRWWLFRRTVGYNMTKSITSETYFFLRTGFRLMLLWKTVHAWIGARTHRFVMPRFTTLETQYIIFIVPVIIFRFKTADRILRFFNTTFSTFLLILILILSLILHIFVPLSLFT